MAKCNICNSKVHEECNGYSIDGIFHFDYGSEYDECFFTFYDVKPERKPVVKLLPLYKIEPKYRDCESICDNCIKQLLDDGRIINIKYYDKRYQYKYCFICNKNPATLKVDYSYIFPFDLLNHCRCGAFQLMYGKKFYYLHFNHNHLFDSEISCNNICITCCQSFIENGYITDNIDDLSLRFPYCHGTTTILDWQYQLGSRYTYRNADSYFNPKFVAFYYAKKQIKPKQLVINELKSILK